MKKIEILREAETACNGAIVLAILWIDRQRLREVEALGALALLTTRRREEPLATHFRVLKSGLVVLYTPEPPAPKPTTRHPRSDSRSIDVDAAHDPRIAIRTKRGARGPRHVFVAAGSTVEHRSYRAAFAQLGAAA